MKIIKKYEHKKFFLLVLILFTISLNAKQFVFNDGVILKKTEIKIEEMANELFLKTGVSAYLVSKKDLNGTNIVAYEKHFAKDKKAPFAIICLALKEQKVDAYNSPDLDGAYDKSSLLSPYPWSGTIIPLLTGKKKNVSVSAALLNGYADMVEQIAKSKDVKLDSAIGSTNRDIIYFVKISIYLFLFVVIGWYFIRRIRKR